MQNRGRERNRVRFQQEDSNKIEHADIKCAFDWQCLMAINYDCRPRLVLSIYRGSIRFHGDELCYT